MSRVFVVQQPTGRDPGTGAIRNTMDLSPASVHGDLVFVLREFENPFANPDETIKLIYECFQREGFGDDDWLLLVGNPCLIGMVASVATSFCDRLRMLQWSKADAAYRTVEAQVYESDAD